LIIAQKLKKGLDFGLRFVYNPVFDSKNEKKASKGL